MKKAKILIPAMGMMLLSTAATISGTMAWFSANREVRVNTDYFQVESLDGALSVTAAGYVGTTADNTGTNPLVSVKSGVVLADASFNHITGMLYTDVMDDSKTVTGYTELGTVSAAGTAEAAETPTYPWRAAGTTNFYYAVAWQMTFSYAFAGDSRSLDLFFDASSTGSNCEFATVNNNEQTKETKNGFRIAFVSDVDAFAWAPYRSAHTSEQIAAGETYNYVSGTATAASVTAYTEGTNLLFGDSNLAKANDAAASQTGRADYLDTFVKSSRESITVTAIAWYEGTDADVVNESKMQKVLAHLKFYVRTVTGA